MEQFPDGAHVRLRSRVHGGGGGWYLYLHADKDGVGVSLRGARGSLSVAWRVHRVQHGGATRVLLHGAAYGRYLAVRPESAPPPGIRARRACRAVQCVYDAPEQDDVLWEAVEAGDDDGGDVLMRHHRYGLWYDHGDPSAVMRWVIEAIPPRPEPPALPAPSPSVGGLRRIRYVRADDDGNFAQIDWGTFDFCLRGEVSIQLAEPFASIGMTLCVRAGLCGRLTPLVTDLPRSEEPMAMDVVVLTTGSPVKFGEKLETKAGQDQEDWSLHSADSTSGTIGEAGLGRRTESAEDGAGVAALAAPRQERRITNLPRKVRLPTPDGSALSSL